MAVLLALVSAACYGVSDFSGGLAARRVPATIVVLVSNASSLLLAALAVWLLPGSTFRAADMAWGGAAGAVGLVGVVLLYRGLALGPMSVVAPLTAVLGALVPVVVGVARGDRPGFAAAAGIALAVPAMALVSGGGDPSGNTARVGRGAALNALAAGVSFGGFYILLAQTAHDGGAWPLVAQRAASVLILVVIVATALSRGAARAPRGTVLRLALVAGVTDFAANLAYVLATHAGLLALVAVLSSLYPVSTLLLARGVLRERISRWQGGGLLLAAGAVALIAAR